MLKRSFILIGVLFGFCAFAWGAGHSEDPLRSYYIPTLRRYIQEVSNQTELPPVGEKGIFERDLSNPIHRIAPQPRCAGQLTNSEQAVYFLRAFRWLIRHSQDPELRAAAIVQFRIFLMLGDVPDNSFIAFADSNEIRDVSFPITRFLLEVAITDSSDLVRYTAVEALEGRKLDEIAWEEVVYRLYPILYLDRSEAVRTAAGRMLEHLGQRDGFLDYLDSLRANRFRRFFWRLMYGRNYFGR